MKGYNIPMDTFVVVIKDNSPFVAQETKKILRTLPKGRYRVLAGKEHASALGLPSSSVTKDYSQASFILSVGGDGTILRSARLFSQMGKPILGINLGRRGFLTEGSPKKAAALIAAASAGKLVIDERMMLNIVIRRGKRLIGSLYALNDIVIGKSGIARVIKLDTYMNGELMTNYSGDGLIVSTPTGSTGHNLSAGGPIVDPRLCAMVITAICSLSISNRSIVIGSEEELRINISKAPEGVLAIATVDGQQVVKLKTGDDIFITRAAFNTKLLRVKDFGFFGVLKEKLGWGG